MITPWGNEDYEVHWGFADYKDKVILDIGADYGSTADFFLHKGARNVIAIECHPEHFQRLEALAKENPGMVAINMRIASATDFLVLLKQYDVDIMKVDCEGCEAWLLELDDVALSQVPEYLVEIHSRESAEIFGNLHPYGDLEELRGRLLKKFKCCGFEIVREFKYCSAVWVIHAIRA